MKKIAARFAACVIPAIALAAMAAPAGAQVVDASYRPNSKTEAILGGAPSALAAITAMQTGRATPIQAVEPSGAGAYFRPAIASYVRPAVSSDRPDIFNSVALSIGRSPLDARWNRIAGTGVGGAASAYAASLRILPKWLSSV